jgi:hypothetical protein
MSGSQDLAESVFEVVNAPGHEDDKHIIILELAYVMSCSKFNLGYIAD